MTSLNKAARPEVKVALLATCESRADVTLLVKAIPLFCKATTFYEAQKFEFTLYVGSDEIIGNDDNGESIEGVWIAQCHAHLLFPTNVAFVCKAEGSVQSATALSEAGITETRSPSVTTTSLMNMIADKACKDGSDYLYYLGDGPDLCRDHHVPGSISRFVSVLRKFGNNALTGPRPSKAFVHRSHYERFGFLFPPQLVDDVARTYWMNEIYHLRSRRIINNVSSRLPGPEVVIGEEVLKELKALVTMHQDKLD